MTVAEFKRTCTYKRAKSIKYYDKNGRDISYKPSLELDGMIIIKSNNRFDGNIEMILNYVEW